MIGFFHADIDNGLSQVALAWMVGQAKAAGVKMDESPITVPASAVLHDKSNNILTWMATSPGSSSMVTRSTI